MFETGQMLTPSLPTFTLQNPITEAIFGFIESSRDESDRIYRERLGRMQTNAKQVGKERDEGLPCVNHCKVGRFQSILYFTTIAQMLDGFIMGYY